MKLKKIASLALAGAMAVSMLAGCATKAPATGNDDGTVTTTPAVVDVVNKGQSADNEVKVTFTDSATLDAGLEKVLNMGGAISGAGDFSTIIEESLTKQTGLKDDLFPAKYNQTTGNWGAWATTSGFLTDGTVYTNAAVEELAKSVKDGDVITLVKVGKVNALNADAAAKQVAVAVDSIVGELATTTYDSQKDATDKANFKSGSHYFNYSYDGNVAMASYTSAAGVTSYYYAVVLNQTVAVKTVA